MASIRRGLAIVALGVLGSVEAETANPIRRVVTMLQTMSQKVAAEGEREKAMFERFMCYCQSGTASLEKAIADAETKIPQVEAALKEAAGADGQLKADLKKHKEDRAAAKQAIAEATAIREKEAAEFAAESSELTTNLAAMTKAIAAVEKGVGGFLQTSAASILRRFAVSDEISDEDREVLTEFLSQGSSADYAPQSGQIVGILKQMKDTMGKNLAAAKAAEEAAINDFNELVAAKTKEVNALTEMIEEKTQRLGRLGVEIVEMMEDLEDTKQSLEEDQKFLAELKTGCSTKEAEWTERSTTRNQELVAIADTIKILNDDDALELFKKTLPGPASLLQVAETSREVTRRALSVLSKHGKHAYRLDLISMMLHGKSVDFAKIIKMVDDMVELLKEEQANDLAMKEQCEAEFDATDDKKKALERSVSQLSKAMDDDTTAIATLQEEIAALQAGIEALDKEVAERTEIRKEEHSDYQIELASHTSAKELIAFAKNRMNKFYNPKLFKAPPKREMSEEERLTVNFDGTLAPTSAPGGIAGTGISFTQTKRDAPPPPPETWDAYAKKSEMGNGVIAMMDGLVKDLDTEITEMQTDERHAQEEYEQFIADAKEKRIADTKSLADKTSDKADAEASLEDNKAQHRATVQAAMANDKVIMNLHAQCDWLLKFFDIRKEARAGEVDSLKKAKAILSGADYSLVQTDIRRHFA